MKIKVLSDLHLEASNIDIQNNEENCGLILAGDIGPGTEHKDFILELCEKFKFVVYVPGNHEFYRGEYWEVQSKWRLISENVNNLYYLDNDYLDIEDVRIIGSTLWTDMLNNDPIAKVNCSMGVADYKAILIDDGVQKRLLEPDDTIKFHKKSREFIENTLKNTTDKKVIVVTHHLPLPALNHPNFYNSSINGAFYSDLGEITNSYDIDYWIYGHSHYSCDLTVCETRFLSNPRGYSFLKDSQENPFFDKNLILEV